MEVTVLNNREVRDYDPMVQGKSMRFLFCCQYPDGPFGPSTPIQSSCLDVLVWVPQRNRP